jgi:hypothetical protein
MKLWKCRLTLIGSKRAVAGFAESSGWKRTLGARHIDWLQLSPGRHVCQFETNQAPVTPLQSISRQWAQLILLLVYENEGHRVEGLAKAKAGEVERCEIGY